MLDYRYAGTVTVLCVSCAIIVCSSPPSHPHTLTPSQMGYDGFFFARNDYDDRKRRVNQTTMEMVWRPSASLAAEESELFTGVLYNGYGPPGGFCFDIHCGDDPIQVGVVS